jgi:uncharacterized membrane protein YuzA (DUF378 family)
MSVVNLECLLVGLLEKDLESLLAEKMGFLLVYLMVGLMGVMRVVMMVHMLAYKLVR